VAKGTGTEGSTRPERRQVKVGERRLWKGRGAKRGEAQERPDKAVARVVLERLLALVKGREEMRS